MRPAGLFRCHLALAKEAPVYVKFSLSFLHVSNCQIFGKTSESKVGATAQYQMLILSCCLSLAAGVKGRELGVANALAPLAGQLDDRQAGLSLATAAKALARMEVRLAPAAEVFEGLVAVSSDAVSNNCKQAWNQILISYVQGEKLKELLSEMNTAGNSSTI